ncbi:MAG: pyridoxamine 5-phosphate oxidase family protein [Paenibacillus sp.]|nr:pyridoxamine 5-phosphate oxidase family protein [Paenibacillus sp.]
MGKSFDAILPEHEAFIKKQHIFFVGSATADSHINISPKGHDVLRIFSPTDVAYLDLTGSGNETSAHLLEDGRITIMFIAFEGAPNIMRLYGTGHVVLPGTPEWDELIGHFTLLPGARQIIRATIHSVKTSCGYSVPFMSYTGERETLNKWASHKGEEALVSYRQEKNAVSMDGIVTPLGRQWVEDPPAEQ